ncbi:MAG: 6-phosphofructokinase, partial [bacterium]|nr:6-phosphofructokinase [bacterium]
MKGYNDNRNIGLLFSGGPAPAANAVISSVSLNFIDRKIPIIGIFNGFEYIEDYNSKHPEEMVEDVHYRVLDVTISRIRNSRGVYLKTSRANPGKDIKCKEDLKDPK